MNARSPQRLARALLELTETENVGIVCRSFAAFLVRHRLTRLLPAITAAFDALVREREGSVAVKVTSAHQLTAAVREQVTTSLEAATGRTPDADWRTDPALIAGFTVRFGDTYVDASAAGALDQLERQLAR